MLGGPGSLVILGIALLVFGPKKLQELAKGMGGLMGEFKKTTEEVKKSIGMNELQGVRTKLTGVDLFADLAEKVSASMKSEDATGEAPVQRQDSVPQRGSLSVGAEKVEKG
jgi:TatA/E family protein of Tat protein translocase